MQSRKMVDFNGIEDEKPIPKILHSRSYLGYYYRRVMDDGNHYIQVNKDTYPDLFEIAFPNILSPRGWQEKDAHKKFLWIPANDLTPQDLEMIDAWGERFKEYVLIGINKHIANHFSSELDYCMALSYDFDMRNQVRTKYGLAFNNAKYHSSNSNFQENLLVLTDGLQAAFADLPLRNRNAYLSVIPAEPNPNKLCRLLARTLNSQEEISFIDAVLNCPKPVNKNEPIEKKIVGWAKIFSTAGSITLGRDVKDKTIVVIDDIYQSGATMWSYAKYLKSKGAKHVLGLVCVKALRDTDNQ